MLSIVRRTANRLVETASLARACACVGWAAVLARSGRPGQISRALEILAEEADRARRHLARRTKPGSRAYYVSGEWRYCYQSILRDREMLDGHPDVIGYGLCYRRRGGQRTAEKCVTVAVRQKLAPAELTDHRKVPIELATRTNGNIPTDVVEAGAIEPQASVGSSVGPIGTMDEGTVGAFGFDLTTSGNAWVAFTAMHVTDRPGFYTCPSRADNPHAPVLGTLLRGDIKRVDASIVSVDSPTAANHDLPDGTKLRGWRPVSYPSDIGSAVRMFGQASGEQHGVIVWPFVSFPKWGVEAGILARIASKDGDSGAVLLDSKGLVLGILKGRMPFDGESLAIYSSIALVLEVLECDIPSS